MGVNLRDIVRHEPIEFVDLKGKIIAIDALNSLYQFLASIRQSDGTPLSDSNGRITSHLSGLLYRTVRLVNMGIKPIYVFDGEPPELKKQEIQRRKEIKRDAKFAWEKAKREGRLDDAKKFASRTSRFTDEMLTDSKKLLEYMGVPHIQAPSEGEAQCVHVCNQGDAWAVGSQDYDTILLGTPRLVRGLTLSGNLVLEMIHTGNVLESLGLTREQLIDLAILVGTDFNSGIKGIGPKKALKIVRENRLGEIEIDFDFDEVRNIFLNPKVTGDYKLEWREPDIDAMIKFLCDEHDFSENRIKNAVNSLSKSLGEFSQRDLNAWF